MVFESIIDYKTAKNKPLLLIILGGFYSFLSLILANLLFPSEVGLTSMFFTVLFCIILFMKSIESEEGLDIKHLAEKVLFKEHAKVVVYLCCLFLGIVAVYTAWFVIMPYDVAGQQFEVQLDTFCHINQGSNYQNCMKEYGVITGHATDLDNLFSEILINNFKVLLICFLFSVIHAAGSLYILTWNATVLSVAIGFHAKLLMVQMSSFKAFFITSISFLKHGLPEMAAYFIAGVAGAILSVAIIKKHYKDKKKFHDVVVDSLTLMVFSMLVLIIAGVFEVYI